MLVYCRLLRKMIRDPTSCVLAESIVNPRAWRFTRTPSVTHMLLLLGLLTLNVPTTHGIREGITLRPHQVSHAWIVTILATAFYTARLLSLTKVSLTWSHSTQFCHSVFKTRPTNNTHLRYFRLFTQFNIN